jgi:hypothetical protein
VSGNVVGATAYTPRAVAQPAPDTFGSILADNARRFGAIGIVGLLLLYLAPGWTRRIADTIQRQPFPALIWGVVAGGSALATAIIGLIATILGAVAFGVATLGSLSALVAAVGLLAEAILVSGFVIYVGFVAEAVVSYLGGRTLLNLVRPDLAEQRLIPLLLGVLIYVAVTAIPVVGGIIGFLAALLVLGAGWIWATERFRPAPAMTIVPPAPEQAQAA